MFRPPAPHYCTDVSNSLLTSKLYRGPQPQYLCVPSSLSARAQIAPIFFLSFAGEFPWRPEPRRPRHPHFCVAPESIPVVSKDLANQSYPVTRPASLGHWVFCAIAPQRTSLFQLARAVCPERLHLLSAYHLKSSAPEKRARPVSAIDPEEHAVCQTSSGVVHSFL